MERISAALFSIPPDDRDLWVRMGMAIKSELGDEGFDIWDAWSRQSDSYNSRDAKDVWRSINGAGRVTAGTLFHEAKSYGWRDNGHQKPTPEEIEARRRQAGERAAKEKAERVRERLEASGKARAIWKASTPAAGDNPYLVRKRVSLVSSLREIHASAAAKVLGYAPQSRGEPLEGRLLVVPVKVGGQISTLELIDESGCKSAISGGQKSGGHWSAQPLPDGDGAGITLLIGEGVATCLSAQQATGYVAVAPLYSGNLLAVAREMRERFPKAVLVILADLVKATGDPDPHAIEAARTVGGRLVIPDFGEDRPSGMTDFNDLHQLQGLEALAECIRRQMAAFSSAQDGTPPGSEDVPRSDS